MIFYESDTFEQMFYKYLEDIAIMGPLFSNEDEFLDDDDYYCITIATIIIIKESAMEK